mgnify:CR=1 FL=1
MRRDLFTALGLIALGAGVLLESLRMPDLAHLGVNPYTVPGIVPGFLGAIIGILGFVMLSRSVIGLRLGNEAQTTAAEGEPNSTPRLLLTLFLTVGYGAFLVDRMPFWLATFIFVLTFILLFEWRRGRSGRQLLANVGGALLQAALTAAAVTFLFERIFLVTLP